MKQIITDLKRKKLARGRDALARAGAVCGLYARRVPAGDRTDAPDPHPVFLPRSRALRGPEIRCGRRGWLRVHCALVVAACVLASAK